MHCFRPMVTGAEGFANVPPGTVFGEQGGGKDEGPEFLGASPDLGHVVLRSEVPLTETTPAASEGGLYEWSADKPASEQLELVSVLPGGGEPASEAILGSDRGRSQSQRSAISTDGSRVVWTSESTKALYMRDLAKGETIQLDAVQGGSGEDQTAPRFQLASPDGSRVLFTDTQRLTSDSGGQSSRRKRRPLRMRNRRRSRETQVQTERPDAARRR